MSTTFKIPPTNDRKEYLLYQVLKMFKEQKESPYVLDMNEMIIVYDGCACDGYCLCDDIMGELGIDDLDDLKYEKVESGDS